VSSDGQALPAVVRSRTLGEASVWFWQFLKNELAPYPGRAWLVGRITIAASITMVLVMTFRIPFGYLGTISAFFVSRENPTATLRSSIAIVIIAAAGTTYMLLGLMMMIDDPITHFLFIAASIFLVFYLLHVIPGQLAAAAIGFGAIVGGIIPLWDATGLSVETRTEATLWIFASVVLGVAVPVVVEYVFHRVRPITVLTMAIDDRLQAIEDVLRQIAADHLVSGKVERKIARYSALGTSRARQQLLHSNYPQPFVAQMNITIALLGRLIDLAASLCVVCSTQPIALTTADRKRCLRLANEVSNLCANLRLRQFPRVIGIPSPPEPSELPLLPEMERTVALIPQAFSGTSSAEELLVPPPLAKEVRSRLFVADAFSNVDHVKFAVRGTLATMLAYVVYKAIDWPGLSTAIVTCIYTALSTIGSSTQKQFLRLGGAIIGGFVFGMGAQIFVLPYIDSIAGFTVLFAVVTAISAWIITSTPRLSYLGLQVAFAFYLIHLQEFGPQTSLSIGRDRVVGILLGLTCMWLIFDRLWAKNALQGMQDVFCCNLGMLVELFEQSRNGDGMEAAKRAIQLRDQINHGFMAVKAQSDAVLFEFGRSRERKLKIREDFKRWQPTLGTLLQVQMTYLQYVIAMRARVLPERIAEAQGVFEEDMAGLVRAMSDDVSGRVSSRVPDVQESAEALRREIRDHYERSGSPIPSPIVDMITLSQNLASIAAPLYTDIHTISAQIHQGALTACPPDVRLKEAS
jgi:multidrug resistance protein MdtO